MTAAPSFQQSSHTRLRRAQRDRRPGARAAHRRRRSRRCSATSSAEIVEQTAPVARTFIRRACCTPSATPSGFLLDRRHVDRGSRRPPLPLAPGTYSSACAATTTRPLVFTLAWPPAPGQTRDARSTRRAARHAGAAAGPVAIRCPTCTTRRLPARADDHARQRSSARTARRSRDARVEILNLPPFLQPPELPPLCGRLAVHGDREQRTWRLGPGAAGPPLHRHRRRDPAGHEPAADHDRAMTIRITTRRRSASICRCRGRARRPSIALQNTALRGQVVGPGGRPIAGAAITTSLGRATVASRGRRRVVPVLRSRPGRRCARRHRDGHDAGRRDRERLERQRASGATVVVPTFHFP